MWTTNYRFISLGLLLLAACDMQDMYRQPKQQPLQASGFFADKRSARPLVDDTVARGQLRTDTVYFAGMRGTNLVSELPLPLTAELLQHGQERYDIFCAVCHDRAGSGNGMIVQRGFRQPPSFHIPRLRAMPIGYFYDVTTRGFGTMANYAAEIPPADRWAIAAYVRALQYSQYARLADVPPDQRQKLEAQPQ